MSFINDLVNEVHNASASITAQAHTTTTTGSWVDVSDGDPVVAFDLGAYTDGTHTFTVSGRDGGSGTTSVTTGEVIAGTVPTGITSTTASGTISLVEIDADTNYDELRVKATETGSTTGMVYGANILEINKTTA